MAEAASSKVNNAPHLGEPALFTKSLFALLAENTALHPVDSLSEAGPEGLAQPHPEANCNDGVFAVEAQNGHSVVRSATYMPVAIRGINFVFFLRRIGNTASVTQFLEVLRQ